MKLESAGVIVPNNCVLKGESDLSLHLEKIGKCLKCAGYDLKKISILQETDRSIACELSLFTKLYDVVIILLHFNAQCVSQALAHITSQELAKFTNISTSNGMNTFWPASAKVLKSNKSYSSVIYIQRIFLINYQSIDEQLNLILSEHLRHYRTESVYTKKFCLKSNGSKKSTDVIKCDDLVIHFERTYIGKVEHGVHTLIANNFETIVNGELLLRNVLGSDILNSEWVDTMSNLIYQSEDKHIKFSIEVIEKCLEEYGVDNVFLSFNGGKDCTVLLHLIQIVLKRRYHKEQLTRKLFCLYVRSDNSFKEQDDFIEQCMIFYNLEVMSVATNIKDALQITINKKPHLKACFMGTRRTDPFCSHLTPLQMTDTDWPEIMRCSPFLDWHYSDIWDYLLYYKVPYCKLYDYGFTSLGSATNTICNPNLLFHDGDREVYLPAYKMLNEKKERSGRNVSKI